MLTINSLNQIYVDGKKTKLAVVQHNTGTTVYWFKCAKDVEMPFKHYSLVHMDKRDGLPGLIKFKEHILGILNGPKVVSA